MKYPHICLLVPLVMAKSMFDFPQIILGNSKTMLQHLKKILLEVAKDLSFPIFYQLLPYWLPLILNIGLSRTH